MKKSLWTWFRSSRTYTKVNIVCTTLIASATVAYVIVAGCQLIAMRGQLEVMRGTLFEAHRSGEESTKQMWQAVGNINWMARSMDWSQKSTQKAMAEEVGKLNAQAEASIAIAKSTKESAITARDALYLEQRPWVGIRITFDEPVPKNLIDPGPRATVPAFNIVAFNTGRTPALHYVETCIAQQSSMIPALTMPTCEEIHIQERSTRLKNSVDQAMSSDPKQDRAKIQRIFENIYARSDELETQRENEARLGGKTIFPEVGLDMGPVITTQSNDHQIHYTLGTFVYKDPLDPSKTHITRYCLQQFIDKVSLCDFGQDME